MLATIGYERAELNDFIATLKLSKIEILIDIRDRAQSRRPGFSKSALSLALQNSGIEYQHIPALGDPKEGRDAARRQDFDTFRSIFDSVMQSAVAKEALEDITELARNKKICLMCFERDQLQCHRKIVSDYLANILKVKPLHLGVQAGAGRKTASRRVRDCDQGATASV